MRWHLKLGIVFGGMILCVGGFIVYDQLTTGKIIYKTFVDGTQGKEQILTFNINTPGLTHFLIVTPSIKSGWGDPDVFISATLTDPGNNNLITFGRDIVFGGTRPSLLYERSLSDYEETFPFIPTRSGEYTLRLTVLSEHVKNVRIVIRLKEK